MSELRHLTALWLDILWPGVNINRRQPWRHMQRTAAVLFVMSRLGDHAHLDTALNCFRVPLMKSRWINHR